MSKRILVRLACLLCVLCILPVFAMGDAPALKVRDAGGNYIMINWSGLDQGDVLVFYRVSGSDSWLLLDQVSGRSYTLRDLLPGTAYDIRVMDDENEALLENISTTGGASSAPSKAAAAATEKPRAASRNAVVGDHVLFGTYPQTTSGKDQTPIEWQVVAIKGNMVLLISRYGLDAQPYNTVDKNIIWKDCSLRSWLNSTFKDKAFTRAEQSAIVTVTNKNPDVIWATVYKEDGIKGICGRDYTIRCDDTKDTVFLLSVYELGSYLDSNEKRKCTPTAYASAHGAFQATGDATDAEYYLNGIGCTAYWTRSSGYTQRFGGAVNTNGKRLDTISVNDARLAIRPALWLNMEVTDVWSLVQ